MEVELMLLETMESIQDTSSSMELEQLEIIR
jgi:hypothetical protein